MKTPGINKNSQRHFLRLVCSAMVMVVCHATSGATQEIGDPRHFQVESALVTVPVVVRDAQGRFVSGLPPGSFKLFEDGRQVPISLFLTSEDPIKIALLIDTSRSATTVLKKIKKAAGQFLKQMRFQDLAMVASFDSQLQVLCPLSSDARELKEAIKGAKSGGTYTRMRDAIHEIVQGEVPIHHRPQGDYPSNGWARPGEPDIRKGPARRSGIVQYADLFHLL